MAIGPARVEVGRLGDRSYRMLRRVGYCDPTTGHKWVIPRYPDDWTLNFSSAPTLVNWIIPVLGPHFNAFVLHDALVEHKLFDPDGPPNEEGEDYIGPKVSRERADEITRDAMGEQGTGFVRRWVAWVGVMIGTVFSLESPGASQHRGRFIALLGAHFSAIAVLGAYNTGEVVGWWNNLAWMDGEGWFSRLMFGAIGAIGVPIILSIVWGRRWLFGLLFGLLVALLFPAVFVTGALTALYFGAERLFKWFGYTKPRIDPLLPGDFSPCDPDDGPNRSAQVSETRTVAGA